MGKRDDNYSLIDTIHEGEDQADLVFTPKK